MTRQKYNWASMVRDIMDIAFMSQVEMADRLKVSQQSVSNWLNGVRTPRATTTDGLLKLAQSTALDIGKYEANPELDKIEGFLKIKKGREFARLLELYGRMSMANKKKLMNYAEREARAS